MIIVNRCDLISKLQSIESDAVHLAFLESEFFDDSNFLAVSGVTEDYDLLKTIPVYPFRSYYENKK